MAVGAKYIEQAVVVVIEKSGSPAQKWKSDRGDSCARGHIGKIAVAIIAIESVVVIGKIRNVEIDFSVAVVIAHRDAHGRLLAPFIIQCKPGNIAYVLERAIVFVAVEILGDGVVGHR